MSNLAHSKVKIVHQKIRQTVGFWFQTSIQVVLTGSTAVQDRKASRASKASASDGDHDEE